MDGRTGAGARVLTLRMACARGHRHTHPTIAQQRFIQALPWYRRLNISAWEYRLNHVVVSALTAVGIAPRGTAEVHNMLVNVARDLAAAGELGIFTPMHKIVLRKRV